MWYIWPLFADYALIALLARSEDDGDASASLRRLADTIDRGGYTDDRHSESELAVILQLRFIRFLIEQGKIGGEDDRAEARREGEGTA